MRQSWSGLVLQEHVGRSDVFFRRMFKHGFCQRLYSFEEISNIFGKISKSHICLHLLLPPEKNVDMQLRPRGHNYS